jgi:hypothetical protein
MTPTRTGNGFLSLLFAATAAALPLAAPSAGRADTVPFEGSFEGMFAINPLTLHLHFEGDGLASHLGDSEIIGDSQLAPDGPGCLEIVADAVTLTAANGDQLFLTNVGEDCFDETGHIVGSATFRVTGGTSRFAGATGSGTTRVVAMPDETGFAGTFVLTFTGRISY